MRHGPCSLLRGVMTDIFRRIVEMWYGLRVFPWPEDWLDPELYEEVKDIGE